MFNRSGNSYAEDLDDLQKGVRTLQRALSRLAAGAANSAIRGGREYASDAANEIAGSVRNGAHRVGEEAARWGRRASSLGHDSFEKISRQVGLHPLMIIGVAVGVGALIGAARYRPQNGETPQPRRRKQLRKGTAK
jgi:hypothetical protein